MNAKPLAWALAFLLAGTAGFPQARQTDRAAAEQFLAQARLQAAAGSWTRAAELLDSSLQFFPEYSEGCLLYARLRLREQAGTREGLDWLARALASNTWTTTDPRQASTELAAVLVRTRRFAEARLVLAPQERVTTALAEGAGESPGLGAQENPDAALLWGRTLRGLGDAAAGAGHLELALARYPRDPRLYLEAARARQALRQTARALELLARGRRALPAAPELTLEAARLERERARRLALLEEYARQGGAGPAAAALALSLGPREPAVWLERFLAWGGASAAGPLHDLLAFYRARSTPEPLLAALRSYSGDRLLDADEDGWHEERFRFQDGGLAGWTLDRDQDGAAEAEVLFESGVPRSLMAGGLNFRYSSYPFLAAVTAGDERGRRVYELQPYRERLALFAGSAPFGAGPLRLAASRWPTEAEAARLAFAMRETAADDKAERRYTLLAGQVARMEEAPDGNGRYGRVVEYSRGRPVAGRRDLDLDGIFETRESYAGGVLTGLSVDRDADGRPEYREQFGPEGTRHFWDYDDDGLADSRELLKPDGSLLREFASRRDGVFDLAAVFRGDALEEFRRGGRVLPVTPSSVPEVLWLGRPAARPERFLALPDGLHLLGAESYFVFTHGGRRYVEPL